ncbi:MAG: flagellar basal body P-ring protein FlgI [Phycisphaerales bacterium]|nr:flagellar basal body P-ring protein FlgI [Phycisphaerales bacterium]
MVQRFARARFGLPLALLGVLTLGLASLMPGCGARGTVVDPGSGVLPIFDGPSVLRGTVGASASIIGVEPVLVSGLGIVVGTSGDGGPLPPGVEATVVRQLSLRSGTLGMDIFNETRFEGESPESFLRRPDVSVVVILGLIAPGAPEGSNFDVLAFSLNNEDLSGGNLWQTDLRLGRPTVQGGPTTRLVGFAQGPVYTNPFASGPRANNSQGRIIGGGTMTNPLELAIRLNVPSPRRTRAIASMINTRFGESPLDRGDIASGRLAGQSDAATSLITVSIPWSYKDRSEDFLRLVAHINPDAQGREELFAGRYIRALREEPGSADRIAWALEALGPVVINGSTTISTLYDAPEVAPRMAALRVGARLGDPNAERPLIAMARDSSNVDQQLEALKLLGELGTGAMVDATLRDLATSETVSVRVAAYEAMARREGLRELRAVIESQPVPPGVDRVGVLRDWNEIATKGFRGSLVQGLRRDVMPSGFIVDRVPLGDPLIFLRQQGQAGLVLFGPELSIEPGAVLRLSDDLVLARPEVGDPMHDPEGLDVRVRYRHQPADFVVTVPNAPSRLHEFIEFLATRPTLEDPLSGLGMGFGDIVSVVSELQQSGAIKAQWQVERNILREGVNRRARSATADRPELEGEDDSQIDPLQTFIERSIRGEIEDSTEETGLATPIEPEG